MPIDAGVHTTETEVTVAGIATISVAEPDLVESWVEVAVIVGVPAPEGENTPEAETVPPVADQVTPEQLKLGMLFPPQSNILEVEVQTAARVAKLVFDSGLARVQRPANVEKFIRQHVYKPEYRKLA